MKKKTLTILWIVNLLLLAFTAHLHIEHLNQEKRLKVANDRVKELMKQGVNEFDARRQVFKEYHHTLK